jgi:protein-S-isoprenylcysteine O-methyltransferase Ste14
MANEFVDRARVTIPPPLTLVVSLVVGLLLHRLFPVSMMSASWPVRLLIAAPFLLGYGVINVVAIRMMLARNTTLVPHGSTTTLVSEGPFGLTRNPLYLSVLLLYAGIAVLVNEVWMLCLLPVMLIALDRGAVIHEEKYLEQKFGDQYLEYKRRVRRWI